jgi:hypothetical protein
MTRRLASAALFALTLTAPAYAAKAHPHYAAAKAVAAYDNVKTNIGSISTPTAKDPDDFYTCEPSDTEATCHAAYKADLRENAEARAADVASLKLSKAMSRMHCADDAICAVTVPIEDDPTVTDAELDAYRTKRLVETLERNR